jgi:hypothetical protein
MVMAGAALVTEPQSNRLTPNTKEKDVSNTGKRRD